MNGVDTVAGIPGGGILPLYDELTRYPSIKHVLVRHEQAAGFIAQGIARSTGKVGVCFATSGPGAMNLLTAIADARCDSVPIIAITGQVNTALIGTDAFQEADTFGLSFPIAKHSMMIKDARDLLAAIPKAFDLARCGRPGPVVIDVPRDVQLQKVTISSYPDVKADQAGRLPLSQLKYMSPPDATKRTACDMARVLVRSKKPVLLAGGGAANPMGATATCDLMKALDIAAVSTLMGLGSVPCAHPSFFGMVGMHGHPAANIAMHEADAVLVLGARFDDRATGLVKEFCPKATVMHVDIDAAEVNKIVKADLSIVGYVQDALPCITCSIKEMQTECLESAPDKKRWLKALSYEREKVSLLDLGRSKSEGALNPKALIASLPRLAAECGLGEEDLIVTTDVGQHQMWAAASYPVKRPMSFLTSGSLGTMGFGLPAAIGAALAHPAKKVVCITGDGSILMNIQELATLGELGLNVTVLLFDNGTLGMVRQQQHYLFEGRFSASEFKRTPNFVAIAQGFGIAAFDAALTPSWWQSAFACGPCLVRLRVEADEMVLPFVKPGCANTDVYLD